MLILTIFFNPVIFPALNWTFLGFETHSLIFKTLWNCFKEIQYSDLLYYILEYGTRFVIFIFYFLVLIIFTYTLQKIIFHSFKIQKISIMKQEQPPHSKFCVLSFALIRVNTLTLHICDNHQRKWMILGISKIWII